MAKIKVKVMYIFDSISIQNGLSHGLSYENEITTQLPQYF